MSNSATRLPLSAGQREIWVAHQLDATGALHNCGGYVDIPEKVDESCFARAVRAAIAETDALRARFTVDESGQPWQEVATDADASLQVNDFSGSLDPWKAAQEWMLTDLSARVDLSDGPLIFHSLLRLRPDHYLFYFRYHHIVLDGYGQVLYWRRVARIYASLVQGASIDTTRFAALADLLDEDQAYRDSRDYQEDRSYWLDNSRDWPARLTLSDPAAGMSGASDRFQEPVSVRGIAGIAAKHKKHWSVVVLAATAAYLSRIAQRDEIIIGLPVRARTSRIALTTPGMLANILPLRLAVEPTMSFQDLIEQVSGQVRALLQHQRFRGEELYRELRSAQGIDDAAPGIVVNVVPFDGDLQFGVTTSTVHQLSSGPSRDLSIEFFGGADGTNTQVSFAPNPVLHDSRILARHRNRLVSFIATLSETDPSLPLRNLEILSPGERAQVEAEYNRQTRDFGVTDPLHSLVEAQAGRTPDAIAVETEDTVLTYADLIGTARSLAAYLRNLGMGPGDIVAVHDERSGNLIIELLAVLMAGAAYLPLDPELPSARLAFQVEDSSTRVVLSRSDLIDRLPPMKSEIIAADQVLPTLAPCGSLTELTGREDAAYVIYTSGSTGRPKGVAVPHRGVVNRLLWMQDEYGLDGSDRVLQKTPFTFDVSVWEFFWPLITGAVLHMAAPGLHRDPRGLADVIREHQITTVHFVPSMLDLFLAEPSSRQLTSLRRIFCSGETLRSATVGRFFDQYPASGPELYNLYGPTEASIDVSHWRCTAEDARRPVPIGSAVANTGLYILDRHGDPLPHGTQGELYIGGVQVALGYLNRAELTAAAFVDNPFGPGILYRTGDQAVMREDGVVLYRGRMDHQVKVNGLRIELGEIESVLLSHPAVQQAVVTAPQNDDGRPQLVGYVVLNTQALDPGELLGYLRERLPASMVPAHLMTLAELPRLSNGKLDRSGLPSPAGAAAVDARPPQTPGEHILHRAWSTVLGAESLSTEDPFFAVGGDSMSAIKVRAQVEQEGFTFTVSDLLNGPSIRQLAKVLRPLTDTADGIPDSEPFGLLSDEDQALLPGGLDDAYPLSMMQAGMLYHAAFAENSSVYRVVTSVRVSAAFDRDMLRAAVDNTAARHPSLRCSFDLARYSEPLQLVHHAVSIPIETGEDLRRLDEESRSAAIKAWAEQAKFTRFDPQIPPLLKFVVHACGADSFELSVIEHHVVLDGWSDMRMLSEIVDRYLAQASGQSPLELPEVRSTYRDFVAAERAVLADQESRAYWRGLLRDVEPTPLPGRVLSSDGHEGFQEAAHRRFDVPLPAEIAGELRELSRREGLPLKSVLAAAHLCVLRLVSGNDEVLTGVVANVRLEQEDGNETIGVFLNTLPIRMDLSAATLIEAARAVFDHERESAPHRRYPLGQMQRDVGEGLQLDSYVNFMDFHRDPHAASGAGMTVTVGLAETNYPLAVNFLVNPDQGVLQLWLDCDLAQLPEEFCVRLVGYYGRALAALARDPGQNVVAVDLLSAAEHDQLAQWNDTGVVYDPRDTVHGQFERRVLAAPDAVAIAHHHTEIRYRELDARANQLAHHLRAQGVGLGDLVGVSLRRGIDLVVALLAVLKAGAAYVPMDPSFPRERLEGIASNAGIVCLVKGPGTPEGLTAPSLVDVRGDADAIAAQPTDLVSVSASGDDTAYVIYTSGSTGEPKGTALRHRNAVNFFAGMDRRVGMGPEDVVLAVTSVSFDISVLELLWPLTHGAKVVVAGERIISNLVRQPDSPGRELSFSLFFFAASAQRSNRSGYQLVIDAARFADHHGFEAVWTPERHFNAFGGLYPNPSVMSAALSTITERIALRSGSVVAPLHDVVRIAEEWSLVDNLSNGRVGLAFASGWNSNDFALRPENFPVRKECMTAQIAEFRALWRGEHVRRTGGSGEVIDVRIFPQPVQNEPPIWLTSVGTVTTFEKAGASGANLLTHLFGQSVDELAEKIRAYRSARKRAGHDTPGQVTVMVHTFMSGDAEAARRQAREPFRQYLRSSTELWRVLFASTGHELPEMGAEQQIDAVIDLAIDRYFESAGLFGSPDTCADLVRALSVAGVDEVACLVDFGVDPEAVLRSLEWVDRLRDEHAMEAAEHAHSLADLCIRHAVTLIQGTPSLFTAVATEPEALTSLRGLRALLIGGEAFPPGLAQRLTGALPGVRILNMYGPTETTVWSSVHELDSEQAANAPSIPIGRPIANTEMRVVDTRGRFVPVGVSGELWIGGDGVAVGYVGRPDLTAERFVPGIEGRGRFYRTGDRVRWRADGQLEFLGRLDRQVKILGHRVEPDEVENVLSRHPQLDAVAVTTVQGANGTELVAYVSPSESASDAVVEDAHVRQWAEVWESAYTEPVEDGSEFAGWISSYTGAPIPAVEMREWLARTVERIRALRPTAVADVGVGAGLILRSLAKEVDQYHGIDLSPAALATAAASMGGALPDHVLLRKSGPEYLADLKPDSLDTVVINSVAQYFPSTDYLRNVLTNAVRVLRPGGALFVGDVRSFEMLDVFCTDLQIHRASPLQAIEEFQAAVRWRIREERELCLSPAFFRQLADELDEIAEVRIEVKRGFADNELTRYRYDVTLLIANEDMEPDAPVDRLAWDAIGDLDRLSGRLAAENGALHVTGIPNQRLSRITNTIRALETMDPAATVWDLDRALWDAEERPSAHPEEVAALAAELGRQVRLLVPSNGQLDTFDAVFGMSKRTDSGKETEVVA